MARSNRANLSLGPLERAVMQRLWEQDDVADVTSMHLAIGAPRGLAKSTIHSTLERLVRKGLASRRRRGRAHEYEAAVTQSAWISTLLDSMVGELDAGMHDEVLAGFVDFVERTKETTLETLEDIVRARMRERDTKGNS